MIYGLGLLIVFLLVAFLLFLTFENAAVDHASFGMRGTHSSVQGAGAIWVNVGIVGLCIATLTYIISLLWQGNALLSTSKFLGIIGAMLIAVGVLVGGA
ncbi:hypothetical protein BST95_16840 [Halioglobus japonicus]|nr:hypothetical protein BST95_16840 [Halioglobus japonicus]